MQTHHIKFECILPALTILALSTLISEYKDLEESVSHEETKV